MKGLLLLLYALGLFLVLILPIRRYKHKWHSKVIGCLIMLYCLQAISSFLSIGDTPFLANIISMLKEVLFYFPIDILLLVLLFNKAKDKGQGDGSVVPSTESQNRP